MFGELEEFHVGLEDLFPMVDKTIRTRDFCTQDPVGVAVRVSKGKANMAVFLERLGGEEATTVDADVLDVAFVRRGLSKQLFSLDDDRHVFVEHAVCTRDTHFDHHLVEVELLCCV